MIRFLSIRDLAVIHRLELELDSGFTILTGETGAGKSIVVGALSLLRGARASATLVRTGADRAVIEATAETPDGREQTLRREISAEGRSRAYIDDRLVPTVRLREIGASLLDLHGQHQHQALLDPESHLAMLDRHADLVALQVTVSERFASWRRAFTHLEKARTDAETRAEQTELLSLQLRAIEEVGPVDNEDVTLQAQRQVLANASRIRLLATESYAELYEGDHAALDALDRIWKKVEELAQFDSSLSSHLDARTNTRSHLEELAYALRSHVNSAEDAAPERLQAIEDRLARLEDLKRRYGPSLSDVITRKAEFSAKLEQLNESLDIESLVQHDLVTRNDYLEAAETLSRQRRKQGPILTKALERSLADLAMEQNRFAVVFQERPITEVGWTERGLDEAEFYFSANPGEELRPLARTASGGELSRVMLALRTVASTETAGRTLVFDEVDAGIGGEAAERVGAKLRHLADRYQVICVTHLPQIAAYGTSHHLVSKSVTNGRTTTTIAKLDGERRTAEIARMMTGNHMSGNVMRTARELLTQDNKS